jgi:hypothetical protein
VPFTAPRELSVTARLLPDASAHARRYNDAMSDVTSRVPVVAGLAYREQLAQRPSTFEATLVAEPENRFFRHAIAVMEGETKLGYVAPEVAVQYFDLLSAATSPVTCPARRSARSDHETSGVELLLDFSALPEPA